MSENNIVVDVGRDASGSMQQQTINLLQLASIDFSQVEEYRFEARPAGLYHWRVKNAELASREQLAGDGSQNKVNRPVINLELEVVNCFSLVDGSLNPADQIGATHNEGISLADLAKGLGRFKALCVDAGYNAVGDLNSVISGMKGFQFVSAIKTTKSKQDPDRSFSNIDKPRSLAEYTGGHQPVQQIQVAGQVPAGPAGGVAMPGAGAGFAFAGFPQNK